MTEQDLKDTIVRQAMRITELEKSISMSSSLRSFYREKLEEAERKLEDIESKRPTYEAEDIALLGNDDDIGVGLTD